MSNLTINANSIYDRVIRIGRQTENLVSSITFNLNMWIEEYGQGECVLNVKRNGDGSAYPVPMSIIDGTATWTITDTDTAKKGRGEIQLKYTVGEKVKTSPIFTISCGESLVGGEVPEPYEEWLTELNRMTAEVEAAKTSADASAQSAQTAAQTATEKATEAEQSAEFAYNHYESARQSAVSAQASKTGAVQAAANAHESATEAAQSAQAASQSAQTAESAKQAAQTAESNAQGFAQTTSAKASEAAESAAQAQESVTDAQSEVAKAKAEADRAKTYADRAAEVELEIPTKVSQLENDAGYLTEHQSLSDYVRKDVLYSMLPTDSVNGSVASFPDGADDIPLKSLVVDIEPVQDLHGYDSPWPAGGKGNYLRAIVSEIKELNTSGIWNGNTYTYNGIDITLNADANDNVLSYTVSGLPTDVVYFMLNRNTQYLPHDGTYEIIGYKTDNSGILQIQCYTPVSGTFTSLTLRTTFNSVNLVNAIADYNRVYLTIRKGDSEVSATVYAAIIPVDADTSVDALTPYQNICPISGWTGCNVGATGKNLFNKDTCQVVDKYLIDASGNIVLRNSYAHTETYQPVKSSTLYVFSGTIVNSGTFNSVAFYDKDKRFISRFVPASANAGAVFTTPSNCKFIRWNMHAGSYNLSTIQLEKGDSATLYEPFGRSIPISWADKAGTVYGGTLDVLSGKLTAYPYYASYNGEILTGEWISDRDAYVTGTTPTIGAQVVNIGAEGTEIQLEPHEVRSLLGANNIFADTGGTSVEYRADIQKWVEKKLSTLSMPVQTEETTVSE